ncbi:MAG: radical SAM protein [Bacteroidia bacterium]|nr:radical SAM protein [Bacteroidia bacterium]
MKYNPIYHETFRKGLFKEKIFQLNRLLESCTLCPRKCRINRFIDEKGVCKTGRYAYVSSYSPHFGEESVLVGRYGSGTIFFTHCNLFCSFCQNYDISHLGSGTEVSPRKLTAIMLQLQNMGCHNINFVTPTHVIPQILEALEIAVEKGLDIPLVYNSGGYDSEETLRILDGVIDIYMPDFKFWDSGITQTTCNAPDYCEVACMAVKEMHRQVGDLRISGEGIAERGLLIRHLVLPERLAGTREVMRFIANEISANTYVNIMDQYRPCWKSSETPELSRAITGKEYAEALEIAGEEGLYRLNE